jgi:hypothetical protein
MKTISFAFAGMLLVSILSTAWAQQNAPIPVPSGGVGGPAGNPNLERANNALPQAAGGSNRNFDRFDRTQLDRQLGNLRNTTGGPNRQNQAPPQTNQPEDLLQAQQGNQNQQSNQQNPDQSGLGLGGFSSTVIDSGGFVTTPYAAGVTAEGNKIRSMGEFNRNTAAAAIYMEKAREQSIDNRRRAVENYFAIREMNRELRSRERGRRPTQEDLYRYSQSRVPDRLTDAQFNRQVGDIRWPAVLMRPEFAGHRARLEEVFYNRTYYNSGVASPSYEAAKNEADRMMDTLEQLVYLVEPTAYLNAKKFITGLSYEARFVAAAEGLASN